MPRRRRLESRRSRAVAHQPRPRAQAGSLLVRATQEVRRAHGRGRGSRSDEDPPPLRSPDFTVSSEPHSNIARRRAAARADGRSEYFERRQEIIHVAARIFKERGLRGTTLNHVAEAMGADRASLYYYVASKEELFQEIVAEAVKLNLATATAIRATELSAPEKLRQLIEQLMLSYAEFYPVLYVLIQENLNQVPPEQAPWAQEMKRVNREYERVVIDIVREGQNEGTLRDTAPPWLLAYGIIGTVAWTNRWFNPNDSRATADEIGTAFADVILDGIATRRRRRPRRSSARPNPT